MRERRTRLVLPASVLLLSGTLAGFTGFAAGGAAAAPTAASAAPADCPRLLPTAQAVRGLAGTGWTVDQGTTPEPFSATVIGRIADGIAPGIDMIMAELSSPAIEAAGGVWAGMSGSPVYAQDGRLIGSVSYGLAASSPIAGLTPAPALQTLLTGDPDDRAVGRVRVPPSAARALVASGEVSSAEVAAGFRSLPLPISVSVPRGVGADRLAQRLQERTGAPVRTGGGTAGPTAAPTAADAITGGGNLAAAISYGDATLAAVGTTTYTCGDRAVGFGHPFLDLGPVQYSAHGADALYVQRDPVFGPFKVANPGAVAGVVDRDRTVGIRVRSGTVPRSTRIVSVLRRQETGATRTGTTVAVSRDLLPDAAAYHTLFNVDRVLGAASAPGALVAELRVTGHRANGDGFTLVLGNAFAVPSGLSFPLDFQAADWVFGTLLQLLEQPYERITVADVRLTGTIASDGRPWRAPDVQVVQAGRFVSPSGRLLSLPAGRTSVWRATATLHQTPTARQARQVWVPAPASARGRSAVVTVTGGRNVFGSPPGAARSFPALLAELRAQPRGDEFRVEVRRDDGRVLGSSTTRFSRAVEPFERQYPALVR